MKSILARIRKKNAAWISFGLIGFLSSVYLVWDKYLSKTSLTNAEDFSFAFVDLIDDISLLLFFLIIILKPFFGGDANDNNSEGNNIESSHKLLFKATWKTVLFLWAASIAIIIIVNPRGLYGIRIFPQLSDNFRNTRVANYLDLTDTPELVILGSSRTITISPAYITEELGYSAYNFGIAGARVNDISLVTRFILTDDQDTYPKVLLIEVGPTFHYNSEIIVQAPISLLKYMNPGMAYIAFATRFQELFNIYHLAESVYVIQFARQGHVPDTYEIISSDGFTVINPTLTFEEVWADYLEQGEERFPCKNFNPEETDYLEEIVNLATKHNTSVVFYTSPLLPKYYETFYDGSPRFDECMPHLIQVVTTLAEASKTIFFQDLMVAKNINILTGESGFYDGQHLKPINANLMIDVLAETIDQAYSAAAELRNQP